MNEDKKKVQDKGTPSLCTDSVDNKKSRSDDIKYPDVAFPGEGERNQDDNCTDDSKYLRQFLYLPLSAVL